ncbi:4822_t:CDS:2 [Ambispora leptoticha]|uniref:4822_t:CDS:1 n=1 Tax=Ambispora leptoticha TaxID=144679 RepID=A0A9N9BQA7_9GLOM|nr:4822_t:CDS:2 [Ambispora leptoticha]
MASELREQLSEFIGFKLDEIRLPETERDQQLFQKIIADQRTATGIVIDGVLLNMPHNISNKIETHLRHKFKGIPLAPIVRYPNIPSQLDSEYDII